MSKDTLIEQGRSQKKLYLSNRRIAVIFILFWVHRHEMKKKKKRFQRISVDLSTRPHYQFYHAY